MKHFDHYKANVSHLTQMDVNVERNLLVFVSSVFSFIDFAIYVVYNFAFLFTTVTASSFKYE